MPRARRSSSDEAFLDADTGTREWQPSIFEYVGTSYQMNTLVVGQSVIQFAPHDPCVPVWERLNEQLRWTNTVHVGPWGRLALVGDYGWWMEWMPWGQRTVEWHGRARHHNVAFLDGHADFLRIRKGLHVTPDYTVVPFKGLVDDFQACQKEVKGE